MTTRFDNLSDDDVRSLIDQTAAVLAVLDEELRTRLLAACPVKVGEAYKIGPHPDYPHIPGQFQGRTLLVSSLVVTAPKAYRSPKSALVVLAHGRLNMPRSRAGDGYSLRHQVVTASRLIIEEEKS
jgi:hypothetical protein